MPTPLRFVDSFLVAIGVSLTLIIILLSGNVASIRLDPSDDTFWVRAVNEITNHGGFVHPCLKPLVVFEGVAFKVRCHIKTNTTLISIPKTLLLNSTDLRIKYPMIKQRIKPTISKDVEFALAISFLLVENAYKAGMEIPNNKDDFFNQIYAEKKEKEVIPITLISTPAYCFCGIEFTQSELNLLDPDTRASAMDNIKSVNNTWNEFQKYLARNNNSELSQNKWLHKVPLSLFKWAHCVIDSRAYDTRTDNEYFLVPIGDLFNHSPKNSNAQWKQHRRPNWEWFSTKLISPGSEVAISYGDKANTDLVQSYGFVLSNNQQFEGYISRPEFRDPVFQEALVKYAKNKDSAASTSKIKINRQGKISPADLNFLRLFMLGDSLPSYSISKVFDDNFVSNENEAMVWDYVARNWNKKLQKFSGSFKKDENHLQKLKDKLTRTTSKLQQQSFERKILAVEQRIQQRRIFKNIMKVFSGRLEQE